MKLVLVAILALGVAGCATSGRQTEALLRAPPAIPRATEVKNVPFVAQSVGHCGPATLAMAMNWSGKAVTPEVLAGKVITPGRKGSLQQDLISAARREGMLAVPVEGLSALLQEVAGGHPTIVFENLGLSWYPIWHYSIVIGYDLDRQEVVMHSGAESMKRVSLRRFEHSWALGDYWALVVLPPGHLSVAGNELSQMRAAAGLEQVGRNEEADLAYRAILDRWPSSLSAMIGMGNLAFKKSDFRGAARILKRAVTLYPDSAVARHNLKIATSATN